MKQLCTLWWKRKVETNESDAYTFVHWNNSTTFSNAFEALLCDNCCHIWLIDTKEIQKILLHYTLFFSSPVDSTLHLRVLNVSHFLFSSNINRFVGFFFLSSSNDSSFALYSFTFNYSFWYWYRVWQYNDMVRLKTCAITRKSWQFA